MSASVAVHAMHVPAVSARRALLAAGAVGGTAAVTISATVALAGAAESPALVALVRALTTGAPIAVGLWAVSSGVHARFGAQLAAGGAIWFVTTLAESGDPVAYSIGRAAGWCALIACVYLALAFPAGRLHAQAERRLVWSMALTVLVLFVPQLLLTGAFPTPSPFTSCTAGCPANAFSAVGATPAFVDDLLRPLGSLLVFAVAAATAARLFGRRAAHSPRTLAIRAPVAVVAAVYAPLLGLGAVFRDITGDGQAVEGVVWMLALCGPAFALAFRTGLVRSQLVAGHALERLASDLRDGSDVRSLRRALAEALDDPTLRIVVSTGAGTATAAPGAAVVVPGSRVTEIRRDGGVVATIVHDPRLDADPRLLDAGCAMAGVVLDNHRLEAEAHAAMDDLRRSRARIAASALQERRRIERDLHDGAQQRLIALRIELGLAEDLVQRDPARATARLRELEEDVDEALDEMRSLAHGVYPAALADRGVEAALRAATRRSRIPVVIEAHGLRRHPAEAESAVYFCVHEALQNVLKHAPGAQRVLIRLDGGDEALRFSVRDDGPGVPDGIVRPGNGITNMRDRLASIGGEVEIATAPCHGTIVRGWAPGRVRLAG